MAVQQTRKVTLVGANGNIGKHILDGLVAAGHQVNVITRSSSTVTVPENVTLHRGDYSDEAFLESALKDQDVLIAALTFGAYDVQTNLFRAAAAANVRWVVPCEFAADPKAPLNDHMPLMKAKQPYRDLVEDLGVSSWIGVVNGLWLEYVMRLGAFGLGVDARAKTVALYDDGDTRTNFTTLRRVGESLAALLGWPEDELAKFRNGWVYFLSFHVTQRDIWAAAMRATGTEESDWAVSARPSEDVVEECKERMASGEGVAAGQQLLMALTLGKGNGGDYQAKVLDPERLGLKPESLDEVVKSVVDEILSAP